MSNGTWNPLDRLSMIITSPRQGSSSNVPFRWGRDWAPGRGIWSCNTERATPAAMILQSRRPDIGSLPSSFPMIGATRSFSGFYRLRPRIRMSLIRRGRCQHAYTEGQCCLNLMTPRENLGEGGAVRRAGTRGEGGGMGRLRSGVDSSEIEI